MDDKFYNLIAVVKQYPYLYDKNHASFRDVNKRNNAWKEVAKLCKMTGKLNKHFLIYNNFKFM